MHWQGVVESICRQCTDGTPRKPLSLTPRSVSLGRLARFLRPTTRRRAMLPSLPAYATITASFSLSLYIYIHTICYYIILYCYSTIYHIILNCLLALLCLLWLAAATAAYQLLRAADLRQNKLLSETTRLSILFGFRRVRSYMLLCGIDLILRNIIEHVESVTSWAWCSQPVLIGWKKHMLIKEELLSVTCQYMTWDDLCSMLTGRFDIWRDIMFDGIEQGDQ